MDNWLNQIHPGDCLELMPQLPDGCVDAIVTDLPYGTIACEWDSIVPFVPMWEQIKRILKPTGVFVTTASQPFTSKLIMSNVDWFRCEWIWRKPSGTGYLNAGRQPMKSHENIIVFARGKHTYNPQKRSGKPYAITRGDAGGFVRDKTVGGYLTVNGGDRFPLSVIEFGGETGYHPTQKPLALLQYLIRTYTNEGDTVLDFCVGSGTTAVACVETGRNFIGIEKRADYCEVARGRVAKAQLQPRLQIAIDNEPKQEALL